MKTPRRAAEKAHKNLMAATWTKAAKVRRAFKAGRPSQEDRVLDAESAFLESRRLFLNLRAAMVQAEVFTTDADLRVGLILGTPPDFAEVVVVLIPRDKNLMPEAESHAESEQSAGRAPMGTVVWLVDHEAGDSVSVWVQPFLVRVQAARALKVLTRVFAEAGGQGGTFKTE